MPLLQEMLLRFDLAFFSADAIREMLLPPPPAPPRPPPPPGVWSDPAADVDVPPLLDRSALVDVVDVEVVEDDVVVVVEEEEEEECSVAGGGGWSIMTIALSFSLLFLLRAVPSMLPSHQDLPSHPQRDEKRRLEEVVAERRERDI